MFSYNRTVKVFKALLLTIAIYGFAGWVYIAGNAIFHPESLSWPLTHLTPWIREDTFGILSFAASSLSFFLFNIVKKEK